MDYNSLNYTYVIKDQVERLKVNLSIVDDDIVEADETYNLAIVYMHEYSGGRIIIGEINTTTITIYNDDSK